MKLQMLWKTGNMQLKSFVSCISMKNSDVFAPESCEVLQRRRCPLFPRACSQVKETWCLLYPMPHQLCKDRSFFSSPYPLTFCLWGPLTNKTENYWLFRKHLMVFRRSTSNTTLVYVPHREASFKTFIKYECSSWSCFSLFMKYSHSLERRCIICSTCTRTRNEGTWK